MAHLLISGLGNPGIEYENTRHNIGFSVIDAIAKQYDFPDFNNKFSSLISSKIIGSNKITLLKPQTFMNLSGNAVSKVINFYKIDSKDLIVIHDDLDLTLAKIKIKIAGGSGGHNGIKSIDQHIGLDYYRVRIGIGKPIHHFNVSEFVLSKFSNDEIKQIDKVISLLLKNFTLLLNKEIESLMNIISIEIKKME